MATVTFSAQYDMSAAPGSRGTLTSHDSSSFTLTSPSYELVFNSEGNSLEYNKAGNPIRGLVTSIELNQGPSATPVFKLESLSANAARVFALAKNQKSLYALERLVLSGDDTIDGSAESDTLLGFAGSDALSGNDGDDVLVGGSGNDTLEGGNGDDKLNGGSGSDTLTGGVGADELNGGTGSDTASYAGSGAAVTVSLDPAVAGSGGDAQGDILRSIENLIGSENADRLSGDGRANRLEGGQGDDILLGGGGNDTLDGGAGVDDMSGGRGNDVYVVNNALDKVHEEAKGGGSRDRIESSIDFNLTDAPNVENLVLTGSGSISGTGNELPNRIEGNEGANVLTGGAGKDVLIGGNGGDTYVVNLTVKGTLEDSVKEVGELGTDTLQLIGVYAFKSAKSITMPVGLENLDISATGTTRLNLVGNGLANVLTGNEAGNRLSGGGGGDTLVGRGGDDIYVVTVDGDTIVELPDEGSDKVEVRFSAGFASFKLGSNVENGSVASATGGTLIGNELNNRLKGGAGDDTLVGGVGADTLSGGDGSDTVSYAGSSAAVTVKLNGASAATVSGGDAVGDEVTAVENVLGSAHADDLTGDGGDNRLDGGEGADKLAGGNGSDVYVVDNVGDIIEEKGTVGTDSVESSITFDLSVSGKNIEHLRLTGTEDIDGTGSDGANFLTGNDGNNILDGGAGDDRLVGNAGVDVLKGGKGNDVYLIKVDPDTGGTEDTVTENSGEGTDRVDLYIDLAASFTSSVSFRLPANVENLNAEKIIANLQDMLLNISLVGNSLDNTIVGNAGRNRIDGGDGNDKLQGGLGNDTLDGGNGSDILQGGPGNDKLTGGEGGDSFQFESTPDNFNASSSASYKNVDHIVDFISGTDRIQLKQSLFSAAGTAGSVLSDSEFVATATPSKIAAQHIIYDTATGNLFYNSDGIGTAELVLIGVLDGQPALGAADISFI